MSETPWNGEEIHCHLESEAVINARITRKTKFKISKNKLNHGEIDLTIEDKKSKGMIKADRLWHGKLNPKLKKSQILTWKGIEGQQTLYCNAFKNSF